MIKRLVIFALFAAYSVAFSQQPQAAYYFDLKAHGFWVKRGVANLTTVGFVTENKIGVHLYERADGIAWFNKLLVFDVGSQKTLINRDDFPCPIIWVNNRLLCFESRHADIYDENLNLLAHYQPDFSLDLSSALNFVARIGLVKVSPDQLQISVPVGGETEIVSMRDFNPVRRIPGKILALGNDHWIVRKTLELKFTEETVTDADVKDVRALSDIPTYLSSNALFRLTNRRRMNIENEEGHLLHSLGKTPAGSYFVAPDRIGRRFVYEVFVAKSWDISGTAQYKKIVLRVFEIVTGKEIFHLEEVPSEDEPTFEHYVALSPNGTRLAVIRNGVLKIYELPR